MRLVRRHQLHVTFRRKFIRTKRKRNGITRRPIPRVQSFRITESGDFCIEYIGMSVVVHRFAVSPFLKCDVDARNRVAVWILELDLQFLARLQLKISGWHLRTNVNDPGCRMKSWGKNRHPFLFGLHSWELILTVFVGSCFLTAALVIRIVAPNDDSIGNWRFRISSGESAKYPCTFFHYDICVLISQILHTDGLLPL